MIRGCTCRTGLPLCTWCAALAERAGVLAPPAAPPISERVFQQAIVRLAKEHGWLIHYATDSRKSPAGYPDLTLARLPSTDAQGRYRPGQLVIAELKVDAPLTVEQEVWLSTLGMVTETRAEIWTPDAMAYIKEILT